MNVPVNYIFFFNILNLLKYRQAQTAKYGKNSKLLTVHRQLRKYLKKTAEQNKEVQ